MRLKQQLLLRSLGCKSALVITHDRPKPNGRVSIHLDVQRGSANCKRPFQDGAMTEKNCIFIAKEFRKATILQLSNKGLTASKMNVFYHLALLSKALVVLPPETH